MRTNVYHWSFRLALALCFFILVSSTATPQTIEGYWEYERNEEDVIKLLDMLKSEKNIVCVPKYFFGDVYDNTLPDLVVYIDKRQLDTNEGKKISDKVKNPLHNIALVTKSKKRNQLFGGRYIYVMVFVAENKSDKKSVTISKKYYVPQEKNIIKIKGKNKKSVEIKENFKETERLSVSCDSLARSADSGEFAIFSIAKGIGQAFTKSLETNKELEEKNKKEPLPLKMHEMGCFGETRLAFGVVKIPLAENTINRITIWGFSKINPTATFGNYSQSRITSSICMMWTPYGSKKADEFIDTKEHLFKMFLLAHIYIRRPRLPNPRFKGKYDLFKQLSYSVVVGTGLENLDDLFRFENVFIGIGVGHILGNVGIVVGANLKFMKIATEEDPTGVEGKKRKGNLAIGFTFIF
ncbi:hypothetical protein ES705_14709 [subsurface metagenome]